MIVGVALFDGAEELDWAGPWEVLAAWAEQWPDDGVRVFTLAREDGTITCAKGLRVLPRRDVGDGAAARRARLSGRTRDAEGAWRTRRCWTGCAASRQAGRSSRASAPARSSYAAAGLLDGKPATTHWGSLELLPTLGHEIEVRPDDRFVDTGQVITAAGVSAGIDMALHLVARLHSPERAGRCGATSSTTRSRPFERKPVFDWSQLS